MKKICKCCGVEFERNYGKDLCSQSCNYKYLSIRNKENNLGGYKKGSDSAKAHSLRMSNNKFALGNKSTKGMKFEFSEVHKEKIRKHLQENIISKGLNIDNGAKCKFFVINNIRVQGRYELAFISNMISNNEILPSRGETIKTPYGCYTPDFEFEDYFIEIKSTYTIKTCKKSSQFDKIKWVSDNVKKVKIKVLTERQVKIILGKLIK